MVRKIVTDAEMAVMIAEAIIDLDEPEEIAAIASIVLHAKVTHEEEKHSEHESTFTYIVEGITSDNVEEVGQARRRAAAFMGIPIAVEKPDNRTDQQFAEELSLELGMKVTAVGNDRYSIERKKDD